MNDLLIEKEYATNHEIKNLDSPNDNCLRFWCWCWPGGFVLQIRTHKPITDGSRIGKPRDMIAQCSGTQEDLEKMLEYIKQTKERHGSVEQPAS